MKPLKPKHEAFSQALASLESATSAYKRIYGCSQKSAEAHAFRLVENGGVKQRVIELQKASATEAVLSMQERRRIAAEIARDSRQKASYRISALMCDAKLAGEWLAKQEHTGSSNTNITLPRSLMLAIQEQRRLSLVGGNKGNATC